MPTVTLAQLESRVWDSLDNNHQEFPENYVRLVLNQGLTRLNLLIGYNQATIAVPGGFTNAGVLQYQTPAGIIIPMRVDIDGLPMERYSLERLAREHQSWAVDDSSTLGPSSRWASIDLRNFVIHPIDAYGGSLLEVTGIAPIIPMFVQDDVATLDDVWIEILVDYAKMRLLLKEQGKAFFDQGFSFKAALRKSQQMAVWKNIQWPEYWIQKQARPAGGFRL